MPKINKSSVLIRLRGLMDKASDYESEDWRFESSRSHKIVLSIELNR